MKFYSVTLRWNLFNHSSVLTPMARLTTALALAAAAAFLFCGSVLTASATDVTGKWSGSVIAKTPDGETNEETAWMQLVQTGDLVTGTAGPSPDKQGPIKDGKITGDQVDFKVGVEDAVAVVHLQLVGERLQGQAVIETPDGKVTANIDVKRVP
jgi:hypothetical protein